MEDLSSWIGYIILRKKTTGYSMMSEKIHKIGLIGAGSMAEYHIKGFKEAGASVVAMVDKSPENGNAFAQKWGFAGNAYLSIGEMIAAHPEIQAVSVITPNKFHHPLVIEALNFGLHVFCEKPPALNAAEVTDMAETAKANGLVLMFDLNNRARLDSQFVKEKIRSGVIGHINSAQATWMRRTGIPGFGGWFTSKAMAGGGPLIDLLHMIDLALWFMDYPEPDYVLAQTFDNFISDPNYHGSWGHVVSPNAMNDVESACHGFVRFKTGQVLNIHNSWAELIKEEDTFVSLQASKTGVKIRTINNLNSCELYAQKDGASVDQSYRFQHDVDMGRTRAPANFIHSLNGEAEPLTTADEAVSLMRIIDAVYLSASSGRPVQIIDSTYKTL